MLPGRDGQACQKDIPPASIDGGDIVAFVDGLQQAGFITRERDGRDRRRQILGITAAGRLQVRRVEKLLDAAEPGALAALTAEQRTLLHAFASEVLAADTPRSWVPGPERRTWPRDRHLEYRLPGRAWRPGRFAAVLPAAPAVRGQTVRQRIRLRRGAARPGWRSATSSGALRWPSKRSR